MLKALKPFAGPTVLAVLGIGLNMGGVMNPLWGGVLIGMVIFWGTMAIFSNKALLKRFPGLLEWMPFLDPSGGFATAEQLTGKFIQGQTFNISLLAHEGLISERSFDDCDIYGPAILFLSGVGNISESTFAGNQDNLYVTVENTIPAGAIHAKGCSFKRCRFHRISIASSKEGIKKFKPGITADPHPSGQDSTKLS